MIPSTQQKQYIKQTNEHIEQHYKYQQQEGDNNHEHNEQQQQEQYNNQYQQQQQYPHHTHNNTHSYNHTSYQYSHTPSSSSLQTQTQTFYHLHQIYPSMPKYVNDPQQSQIIYTYNLLLKRYKYLYGSQPLYFVHSPASCVLLGSDLQQCGPELKKLTICTMQKYVIVVGSSTGGSGNVRVNNYQSAVYGEKVFQGGIGKLKYEDDGDQYTNIITAVLKVYNSMNNNNNSNNNNIDILIYNDFIQQQHLHYKQSLCIGLVTALHYAIHKTNKKTNNKKDSNNNHGIKLNRQFYINFLTKISKIIQGVRIVDYSLCGKYGCISVAGKKQSDHGNNKEVGSNEKIDYIEFSKGIDIIIANTMTPMPKKMIKGKRENLRICQIQLGIQIIKNQLGAINQISTIHQLQKYLNCTSQQLLQTIEQYLPKTALSSQKIQTLTSSTLIQLLKNIPFANNVIDQNMYYKPYQRIKFYLQEQIMIEKLLGVGACKEGKEKKKQVIDNQKVKEKQVNEKESKLEDSSNKLIQCVKNSHENQKSMLDITSQQIDKMIALIEKYSHCYKIIGNGWGGNLLILCNKDKSQQIVNTLINQFYMSQENRMLLSDQIQQYIKIVGMPGLGVAVLDPDNQIWFC